MAEQYTIRAKDSVTGDTYFVTIIGSFDPATDLNNPATGNAPDPDTVTIVSTTQIAEEFTLKDKYGIQAVAQYPSALSAFDSVSHDFADPCTWWQNAVIVSNETLTTTDNLTYSFAHPYVTNAHKVIDTSKLPSTKILQVLVNGSSIDYTDISIVSSIDWTNGTITFAASQVGKTITASYSYTDMTAANRSTWTLTPDPNTVIAITGARVKMSKNLVYHSPTVFNIKINPAIIPSGLAAQKIYYGLRDFVGFSSRWEVMPAIGDFTSDIVHLLYDYQGSIMLDASLGMYAELSLSTNIPHEGEIGLVTFQCVKIKG
jgi:hypothetical protein